MKPVAMDWFDASEDRAKSVKSDWEEWLLEQVAKGEPLTSWERDYYETHLMPEGK